MHAFWGVGQMSFVKHAIFVNEDAPKLTDHKAITEYILNRVDISELFISKGVVDALDHSSPKFALGGKLGIDCSGDIVEDSDIELLDNSVLLEKMQNISLHVKDLRQYYTYTKNPISVISVEKHSSQAELFKELQPLYKHLKILVIVDEKNNYLDNEYMLIWRVVNNIDSNRDIYFVEDTLAIDATNKNEFDNFTRRWPDDVSCTPSVIKSLKERNIIDIDDEFEKKFLL
jgi:4-hydroxy-3-polyprenylbenzoate decarboxylase